MNPNYEEATMALNFKPEDMSGEDGGRQVRFFFWRLAAWQVGEVSIGMGGERGIRKDGNTCLCDQRPHARNVIIWR